MFQVIVHSPYLLYQFLSLRFFYLDPLNHSLLSLQTFSNQLMYVFHLVIGLYLQVLYHLLHHIFYKKPYTTFKWSSECTVNRFKMMCLYTTNVAELHKFSNVTTNQFLFCFIYLGNCSPVFWHWPAVIVIFVRFYVFWTCIKNEYDNHETTTLGKYMKWCKDMY